MTGNSRDVLIDQIEERVIVRFTHRVDEQEVYPHSYQEGSKREWGFTEHLADAHEFNDAGHARAICKVTHLLRSMWNNPEWDHEVVKITVRTTKVRDMDVLWPLHPLEALAKS